MPILFVMQSQDMFSNTPDIEDFGKSKSPISAKRPIVTKTSANKRKRNNLAEEFENDMHKSWREVLGESPKMGTTKVCMVHANHVLFSFI